MTKSFELLVLGVLGLSFKGSDFVTAKRKLVLGGCDPFGQQQAQSGQPRSQGFVCAIREQCWAEERAQAEPIFCDLWKEVDAEISAKPNSSCFYEIYLESPVAAKFSLGTKHQWCCVFVFFKVTLSAAYVKNLLNQLAKQTSLTLENGSLHASAQKLCISP